MDWSKIIQFAFVLIVPVVVAAGALVSLFAAGALFEFLDNPEQLRKRVDAAFRRAPKTAKATDEKHYYRPYWAS